MRRFLQIFLAILCPGVLSERSRPNIIVIFVDDAVFPKAEKNLDWSSLGAYDPRPDLEWIPKEPEIIFSHLVPRCFQASEVQCSDNSKGWNDFGYQGTDQFKTPNIDALAFSGMIMHRHYTLPSCTPSRTALLTGYHPIHTGLQGFPLKAGEKRHLPLSFTLKPQRLKELGYKTHLVGKWHLGYETFDQVPNHRGFDSFLGYYNGYIDYYRYDYNQSLTSALWTGEGFQGYDLHHNDKVLRLENPVYATKLFANRARKLIRNHDTSTPLYLYFSHLAVHTGNDEFMAMQTPEGVDVNKTYPHINNYGRRAFAACMEELDRSVGVVVSELQKKNMLDNSIIVLMSDNGAHTVSVDMPPNWGSNWPLAGSKFTLFEGGVRNAALIWSPLLPKGFVNHGFMHITDWLPTLYSAAGGDVSDLGDIDGVDQWDALQRITTVKRDNILLNIDDKTGTEGVIIDNRWKVVKGGIPGYALYDLHWGKEENAPNVPNPEYDLNVVMTSVAGSIILSRPEYQNVLSRSRILDLRRRAAVTCDVPDHGVTHNSGYVNESSAFRCADFCVFDLIKDPCELEETENSEVMRIGKRFINEYKKTLVKQTPVYVDPKSNPDFFGGAWMPWNPSVCRMRRRGVHQAVSQRFNFFHRQWADC